MSPEPTGTTTTTTTASPHPPTGAPNASRITATDEAVVADTSFGQLPVPRTGDDAVVLLDEMPEQVGGWAAATSDRGQALYEHPAGRLGLVAGELTDIYTRPVTAAQAVRLFRRDLDGRQGESCSSPPTRCVTGHLDGATALVWAHDDSDVLLVALWPDEEAGDLLLDAWRHRAGG